MNGSRTGGRVLTVRGEGRAVRRVISRFFTSRGWSEHRRGPDRIEYRTGHRGATILLGGLAGRRFHLTAPIELHRGRLEGRTVIEIHYRWGDQVGRALGGAIGRARAARVHAETAAELERELATQGLLLHSRST